LKLLPAKIAKHFPCIGKTRLARFYYRQLKLQSNFLAFKKVARKGQLFSGYFSTKPPQLICRKMRRFYCGGFHQFPA